MWKKITERGNGVTGKTTIEDKTIFKKIITNSKSQILFLNVSSNNSYGNKRNLEDIRDLKTMKKKK